MALVKFWSRQNTIATEQYTQTLPIDFRVVWGFVLKGGLLAASGVETRHSGFRPSHLLYNIWLASRCTERQSNRTWFRTCIYQCLKTPKQWGRVF